MTSSPKDPDELELDTPFVDGEIIWEQESSLAPIQQLESPFSEEENFSESWTNERDTDSEVAFEDLSKLDQGEFEDESEEENNVSVETTPETFYPMQEGTRENEMELEEHDYDSWVDGQEESELEEDDDVNPLDEEFSSESELNEFEADLEVLDLLDDEDAEAFDSASNNDTVKADNWVDLDNEMLPQEIIHSEDNEEWEDEEDLDDEEETWEEEELLEEEVDFAEQINGEDSEWEDEGYIDEELKDYLEDEMEDSINYVESENSDPRFEGFLEEEAAEMVWRMRPPVRYQGNKVICWAAAVSSWSMVTRGAKKFKTTQSVIDHFRSKGVVSTTGALRSVKGLKAIKREFGLQAKKLVGGGSMSFINIGSMLKDSHLMVVFRRPGARYFHMVTVYGVDRFYVCYMDPAIDPKLSILNIVKQNRICRKIDLFGDGATEFWVFWKERGTKELMEERESMAEAYSEMEVARNNISSTPTPGKYYQIKKGDNLLKVTGRAYGLSSGGQRLKYAQLLNSNPQNKVFWYQSSSNFNRKYFPEGIISFNPRFTCRKPQRKAAKGEQKCYAIIWIPRIMKNLPGDPNNCNTFESESIEDPSQDFHSPEYFVRRSNLKPRLCFFQNLKHSKNELNLFKGGAGRWAKKIQAARFVDKDNCDLRRGRIPFDTGQDILDAMESLHSCLNRKLQVIHIFGHSGFYGIFGSRTGFSAGIYSSFAPLDPRSKKLGGRKVTDIDLDTLSPNVKFVFHGCKTTLGSENIAKDLFHHLHTKLTNPKVFGHYTKSCAGMDKAWKEYSVRHPNGRKRRSLKDIKVYHAEDFSGCKKKKK